MQSISGLAESSTFRKVAIIFMILGISLAGIYLWKPSLLSLAQGFEGEQNGIWGYQVNGAASTVIGNPLPADGACSYGWNGPPTISSASIKAVYGGVFPCSNSDYLDFAAQTNPIPFSDPYSAPTKIHYYVLGAQQTPKEITGSVEIYTFNINLQVESQSSGSWSFSGDTLWLNLVSVVWNQAYSGQPDVAPTFSDSTGNVFEAPLYAVVTNIQWQNQANSQCSLCTVGQSVTFYAFNPGQNPTTAGQTLVSLATPTNISNLNSTLYGSNVAPDSRMSNLVYYPLVINHFQNACGGFGFAGCNAPSASITVKLYTLRVGEYILTNSDVTALKGFTTQQCTGFACTLNGIGAWLSNPFNQLAAILGIGLIGVFVLIAIIGIGPILTIAVLLSRRRKEA